MLCFPDFLKLNISKRLLKLISIDQIQDSIFINTELDWVKYRILEINNLYFYHLINLL